jgi:hypothetical protein
MFSVCVQVEALRWANHTSKESYRLSQIEKLRKQPYAPKQDEAPTCGSNEEEKNWSFPNIWTVHIFETSVTYLYVIILPCILVMRQQHILSFLFTQDTKFRTLPAVSALYFCFAGLHAPVYLSLPPDNKMVLVTKEYQWCSPFLAPWYEHNTFLCWDPGVLNYTATSQMIRL